jgi:hypothetical protein
MHEYEKASRGGKKGKRHIFFVSSKLIISNLFDSEVHGLELT